MPDIYQGNEIVAPALVDPDNRRAGRLRAPRGAAGAVSTTARRPDLDDEKLLGDDAGRSGCAASGPSCSARVRLRAAGLDLAPRPRLRRAAGSVAATVVTRWPGLLRAAAAGEDAGVTLPPGAWHDVLTGALHVVDDGSAGLRGAARPTLPVALLVREAS